MDVNLKDMLPGMFGGGGGATKQRRMSVPEALEHLTREAADALIDEDEVIREALQRAESSGIIFLDEIDKIAGREGSQGPEVSREGVQRDILPSDLIPELQGRFPLRVELDPLGRDDLVRILTEPENSLVRQYCALLETEGVHIEFTDDAIEAIAELAETVNERTENIGARRLHTMMERVLEELSFEAPERSGESITIDATYVNNALADTVQDEDLSKYIL